MEIVHTFVKGLYAFKYDEESVDELERLFDEWNNVEILRKFFESNEQDLTYHHLNINNAVPQTIREARGFQQKLISLSRQKNPPLDEIFVNLDNDQLRIVELAKQKSKRKWLRLYAIRIETNTYVITGGAIKLTLFMKDRNHTQKELDKLEKCRNYLMELRILDIESFHELIIV